MLNELVNELVERLGVSQDDRAAMVKELLDAELRIVKRYVYEEVVADLRNNLEHVEKQLHRLQGETHGPEYSVAHRIEALTREAGFSGQKQALNYAIDILYEG